MFFLFVWLAVAVSMAAIGFKLNNKFILGIGAVMVLMTAAVTDVSW